MKKKEKQPTWAHFSLFLSAMIAILVASWWFSTTWEEPTKKATQTQLANEKGKPPQIAPTPTAASTEAKLPKGGVEEFIHQEARAMGKTDQTPTTTKERLQTIADRLEKRDLTQLLKLAIDFKRNGDERFLSVYLMSLSQHPQAAATLMGVALTPFPQQKLDPRLYDQEVVIRSQALEGIARQKPPEKSRQHLKKFLASQNNVPLAHQAQRLLWETTHRN